MATNYPLPLFSLTDLRNNHGISSARLAAMIGVTPATVWHWEQRPAAELKPKQLRMLETVFLKSEIDALLHPEKYFDENGNQIKDFVPDPVPVTVSEPESTQEATRPEDDSCRDTGDAPAGLSEEECADLLNDLTAAFNHLDDNGKHQLVQLATFMYHLQNGLRLPSPFASRKNE